MIPTIMFVFDNRNLNKNCHCYDFSEEVINFLGHILFKDYKLMSHLTLTF